VIEHLSIGDAATLDLVSLFSVVGAGGKPNRERSWQRQVRREP